LESAYLGPEEPDVDSGDALQVAHQRGHRSGTASGRGCAPRFAWGGGTVRACVAQVDRIFPLDVFPG
jgi:hypothetical protein